ncbi:MAG: thiamine pyrophosphate-dependent dehydrogenase E1 component subunit alpha [Gemmatimonadota bacterium]|nr:thiamine pyrophosphate-dependent dehydrogenase E1 component subunit alpha [Gemmatimonadota bacterium]
MRRYAAYDPPEYVSWTPDPDLIGDYRDRVTADPARTLEIAGLGPARLLDLYRGLLRFRLHDIALSRWVKQGVISKAWLGTGEEAATIGAVHALERKGAEGDVVGPMIRNGGACHEMGIPVADMLRAYLATGDGPTRGRDLHVGDLSRGVCSPISMVASLSTVMNGLAMAFRMRGEPRVALTWVGDGATKHGEAHEAFNFAATLKLPVIFIIQNNQVALGTRFDQHHVAHDFRGWGDAYGIPLIAADGNHVLDVYAATRLAAKRCRAGEGPVFIEATTFRMGGHATHDVAEARRTFPERLFDYWGRRDPIGLFEEYLALGTVDLGGPGEGDLETRNRAALREAETRVTAEVETAAEQALASRASAMPIPESAATGVYA